MQSYSTVNRLVDHCAIVAVHPSKRLLRIIDEIESMNDSIIKKITAEEVVWAYKLFLEREPESQAVVDAKVNNLATISELRKELMASDEFKLRNPGNTYLTMSGKEPPMQIEEVSDIDLIFSHVQETWNHLGNTDPYWSVLTQEDYKSQGVNEFLDQFYQSGKDDLTILLNSLDRNKIDYHGFQDCLEFGCGMGRVTRWLSERFPKVYGYDISQSHLRHAAAYFEGAGIDNVHLNHIQKLSDICNLPEVDLIFSIMVLQHNPPPIMVLMIGEMVKSLRPGGVAFFQIPTYRLGYHFSLEDYLSESYDKLELEMHVLPQNKIFEIADKENGKITEVIEDGYVGLAYGARSNLFIIQKK